MVAIQILLQKRANVFRFWAPGPKNEKHLPVFAKESELLPSKIEELFSDDYSGKRDALMLELFYQTGIRLSELIGLTLKDIHEYP